MQDFRQVVLSALVQRYRLFKLYDGAKSVQSMLEISPAQEYMTDEEAEAGQAAKAQSYRDFVRKIMRHNARSQDAQVPVPPIHENNYYTEEDLDATVAGIVAQVQAVSQRLRETLGRTAKSDVDGFPLSDSIATIDIRVYPTDGIYLTVMYNFTAVGTLAIETPLQFIPVSDSVVRRALQFIAPNAEYVRNTVENWLAAAGTIGASVCSVCFSPSDAEHCGPICAIVAHRNAQQT